MENRDKRVQPPPFHFRFRSGVRFIYNMSIYKMPNETQRKLYLATILDEKKKMRMSALPSEGVDSKLSPGNAVILNLKL